MFVNNFFNVVNCEIGMFMGFFCLKKYVYKVVFCYLLFF